MALAVNHSTVVVVPDDGTSPVGTDEWNAAHTLSGVLDAANGGTGSASGISSATQTALDEKVAKAGDTMTNFLTLHADPTSGLHAATKQYVDTGDANTLKTNVTATIAVGYTTPYNLGNITSFTLNPALGNYQYGTNNAAATWTAPASDCAMDVLVTNGATAGAITFSGFTVGSSVGDALTTTNANKFIISVRRIAGTATYTVKALQ